jgi:hypothetical protein
VNERSVSKLSGKRKRFPSTTQHREEPTFSANGHLDGIVGGTILLEINELTAAWNASALARTLSSIHNRQMLIVDHLTPNPPVRITIPIIMRERSQKKEEKREREIERERIDTSRRVSL